MEKQNQDTSKGFEIFEVWKEYEKVAMHFNELIIQLRGRALAGVAIIAAIVSYISRSNASETLQWGMLASVFGMLTLIWIAIWCLDFLYYNRLLLGSVRAIIDLEHKSKTKNTIESLELSKKIEETVAGNFDGLENHGFLNGRTLFYILVFTALFSTTVITSYNYYCLTNNKSTQEATSSNQSLQPTANAAG